MMVCIDAERTEGIPSVSHRPAWFHAVRIQAPVSDDLSRQQVYICNHCLQNMKHLDALGYIANQ